MTLWVKERLSDSPYIETITHGYTQSDGASIRPAASNWHMVFMKHEGETRIVVTGAWTTSGKVTWGEGAELLWLKFKLGTFMPHLPAKTIVDRELALPDASCHSFWLHSSTWQMPTYENADTFVNRLIRDEVILHDSVVDSALKDHPQAIAPRTVRHRFLKATGVTQSHIRQVERAQQAEAMLREGISILDTVYELGYYDQPHLTRALKQWVGYTPAQIARQTEDLAILYKTPNPA